MEQTESPVDRLLILDFVSDEYRKLLSSVSDHDLDLALLRDHREVGQYRLQAEKDGRLLTLVNSQLAANEVAAEVEGKQVI